jgi:hypothetical protein
MIANYRMASFRLMGEAVVLADGGSDRRDHLLRAQSLRLHPSRDVGRLSSFSASFSHLLAMLSLRSGVISAPNLEIDLGG